MSEPYATRREFDQLRESVSSIDVHGTRGIGPLSVQMSEVIKDVADLRSALDAHKSEHEQEARDRKADRWKLVAVAVALIGPLYPLLIAIH